MAIAYSGTNIKSAFTQATGTRREIVDSVSPLLVNAGWTIISGSGTGDQILESGTPLTGQGSTMKMRIRLWDPGSGNCACVQVQDVANSFSGATLYLLPTAGKTWTVIACPYQVFIFTANIYKSREFAAFGVPYLPAHLQGVITEAFWGHMNGLNDGDGYNRVCFRNALGCGPSYYNVSAQSVYLNGTGWSISYEDGMGNFGLIMLSMPVIWEYSYTGAQLGLQYQPMTRWHNDDYLLCDALIGWGATAKTDEAKIRGQLWDAVISMDTYTLDTSASFDSHNWHILSSTEYTQGAFSRGSLLVVIP